MGDRWIVADHKFFEHKRLVQAMAERERLTAKEPAKKFRVYRIKTSLTQSNSGPHIRKLEARIAELEAEAKNKEIPFEIVQAVAERSPQFLRSLGRVGATYNERIAALEKDLEMLGAERVELATIVGDLQVSSNEPQAKRDRLETAGPRLDKPEPVDLGLLNGRYPNGVTYKPEPLQVEAAKRIAELTAMVGDGVTLRFGKDE